MMKSVEELQRAKMRSDDRILVLKIIDGTKARNSIGLLDSRIFSGEGNNLHAIKHHSNNLWSLKYGGGILPQPLRQSFTKFPDLKKFAETYFNKRNLTIVEVLD